MIRRTSSYEVLKSQVQSTFDFAVVICYSVPTLKVQMKLLDEGKINKLPSPDYFKSANTTIELREKANGYKDKLATYLFLSSFAFFENYITSVISEVFNLNVTIPTKEFLRNSLDNNSATKAKKALRTNFDHRHTQRYDKFSQELRNNNFIESNKLISIIAVENLLKVVTDLKANQIPEFLTNTIKMEISQSDKNSFGTYRQLRNDIAHGDNPTVTMRKVKEANDFLKKFAGKIDDFLTEHYIIIDNYRN